MEAAHPRNRVRPGSQARVHSTRLIPYRLHPHLPDIVPQKRHFDRRATGTCLKKCLWQVVNVLFRSLETSQAASGNSGGSWSLFAGPNVEVSRIRLLPLTRQKAPSAKRFSWPWIYILLICTYREAVDRTFSSNYLLLLWLAEVLRSF